jgi:threonine dehydratase
MLVTLQDIQKAAEAIKPYIKKTELDLSASTSDIVGSQVYFKFENTQKTGSFKIRGATNKILNLTEEEKKRGVVASSAGNHAQGVALAATLNNVSSKIVMPMTAPLVKVTATKNYGADVVLHGSIYDEAYEKAREIEKTERRVFVHPYEDFHVIAGQGTLALEILKEVPDLNSIVVPIGGGGMIAGIATAIKALNPKCKVIGVQAEGARSMAKSFEEKKVSKSPSTVSTIADGIAIKNPSAFMLENYILKLVDEVVTVTEDEIATSIVFLMERAKTVVEGAAATSVAATQKLKGKLGSKSCAVLCGGNIDLNIIAKVIERGMKKSGRLARIQVAVRDIPGMLSQLTQAIAEKRANIIDVNHDRTFDGLYLGETAIEFVLETSGWEHTQSIEKSLAQFGRII